MHWFKVSLLVTFLLLHVQTSAKGVNTGIELKLLTSSVPFFSMLGEPGKLAGYSIDLNKAILKNAGYDVTVEKLPWARVLKQSENHEYSAISAIVRTPEREDLFFWITPISINPIAIYTLNTPSTMVDSLESASQLGRIGVLRGDYRHQILDNEFTNEIMAFNQWAVAIRSLLKGRTKSLFFSDMGLTLTCIDANLDCSPIKRAFVYDEAISYLAVRRKDKLQPVYQALKKSAEEFKASPDFVALTALYLNSNHPAAKFLEVSDGIIRTKSQ
jgi:polar amino acid transport system substrate-binding protein